MKKQIYDEKNGLDYILVGDYYIPLIRVAEETRDIGFYGSLRRNGSTPTLVKAFTEEAESAGNAVTGLWEDRACQEQPL